MMVTWGGGLKESESFSKKLKRKKKKKTVQPFLFLNFFIGS